MNFERYLAIPYLKDGRTETGADCWGLAGIILKSEAGIELPFMNDCTDIRKIENRFIELTAPEDLCIVHMRGFSPNGHVGVFWDGTVIHMVETGVVCQPIKKLKTRILGFHKVI